MAGNNDRIHGYNPIYRAADGNFASFDLDNNRPKPFKFRQVAIDPPRVGVLDHQGHIIPQNILNLVLDPLAEEMARLEDQAEVDAFIDKPSNPAWLRVVREYGKAIHAPMFDFEADDIEDRVGGFFSIVTWNPINICRAPADDQRNGYPGNHIDSQVGIQITRNPPSEAWCIQLRPLLTQPGNPPIEITTDMIEAYITACCASLPGQLHTGVGYYAFPWRDNGGVLQP